MTLVVALVGKDHIVMAADTDTRFGDAGGYYRAKCHKLQSASGETWILGVAGSSNALGLIGKINSTAAPQLTAEKFVYWYTDYFFELYQSDGNTEEMWFLMAGLTNGFPLLYRWSIEKLPSGLTFRRPHTINGTHDAVGAKSHGALYFVSEHHATEMTLEQRVCLAHFAISEATKHDVRLGLPAEFAIVEGNRCFQFMESALPEVMRQTAETTAAIRQLFTRPAPTIDLEALRSSTRDL